MSAERDVLKLVVALQLALNDAATALDKAVDFIDDDVVRGETRGAEIAASRRLTKAQWLSGPQRENEIGTTDPRTAGAGLDPDNASHSIRKSEGAGDVSASTNTWRHKKRGTLYTEVACAWLQTETPIGDGATMTIYRDDDGRWWVRPRSEFMDGRFEAVPAAATCSENAVGTSRTCGACGAMSIPVEGEAFDACPMCYAAWPEQYEAGDGYLCKKCGKHWGFHRSGDCPAKSVLSQCLDGGESPQ